MRYNYVHLTPMLIASLAPILTTAGPSFIIPLLGVSAGIMTAGILLLNGKRAECYATMIWTISFFMAVAFKIVFRRHFKKGIGEILYLLGIVRAPFSAKRLARELCKCDIDPKCGF